MGLFDAPSMATGTAVSLLAVIYMYLYKLKPKQKCAPRYDYVVIGAGSAGCVVASRLSEDPRTSVLLLEAGLEDTDYRIAIPAAGPALLRTENDWNFEVSVLICLFVGW